MQWRNWSGVLIAGFALLGYLVSSRSKQPVASKVDSSINATNANAPLLERRESEGVARSDTGRSLAASVPSPARTWTAGLRDRERTDAVRKQLLQPGRSEKPSDSPVVASHPPQERYPSAQHSANQATSEKGRALQQAVRSQYFPLLKSCYETALQTNPKLSGKFVLQFAIAGNQETGGVVTEVLLLEETTLKDPALLECMKESLYAVFFEPPDDPDAEITVVYPIELGPG